jgi:hypothetical protein
MDDNVTKIGTHDFEPLWMDDNVPKKYTTPLNRMDG